ASPGKSTCPALKPSVLMQSYPAIGLSHSRQGYPLYKPTPVRLRYVPRHPLGFLQTLLLPVAPLPAGYLPAGWAVGFLSTHRLGRHAGRTAEGGGISTPSWLTYNLPENILHLFCSVVQHCVCIHALDEHPLSRVDHNICEFAQLWDCGIVDEDITLQELYEDRVH